MAQPNEYDRKQYLDHMRKVLKGEIENINYEPLQDIIDFDGFSFAHGEWSRGEVEILQPRLEKLGYTDVQWTMGESDCFGPLTRVCQVKDSDGELHWFFYG